MDRQHLVTFIAIGVAIFASLAGAAIAIGAALWSAGRAKAAKRA